MTIAPPKPRFAAIPALLFAFGLGAVFHYGHAWYRLPVYSPAELEQSVEINLALDLQSRDAAFNADSASIHQLRVRIHDELQAEIAGEQREVQRGVATGLILLAMGLGQMLWMRRMAAR